MQITMLKSKIHRATVTDANLNYQGSITLDPALCAAARLRAFERVEVYNCANGERFATYVILGTQGEVCLNGAAARLAQPGDPVIVCSYVMLDEREAEEHRPTLVFVDGQNRIQAGGTGE